MAWFASLAVCVMEEMYSVILLRPALNTITQNCTVLYKYALTLSLAMEANLLAPTAKLFQP